MNFGRLKEETNTKNTIESKAIIVVYRLTNNYNKNIKNLWKQV